MIDWLIELILTLNIIQMIGLGVNNNWSVGIASTELILTLLWVFIFQVAYVASSKCNCPLTFKWHWLQHDTIYPHLCLQFHFELQLSLSFPVVASLTLMTLEESDCLCHHPHSTVRLRRWCDCFYLLIYGSSNCSKSQFTDVWHANNNNKTMVHL